MALHYLTVQDILWINLQVTKKVQHFNYAKLEEASFYQYAYGDSKTLFPQAARFISGFLKLAPFGSGNEATAFVGCLAFLKINGYGVSLSEEEAFGWFDKVSGKLLEGETAISSIAKGDGGEHHSLVPDVRGAIKDVLHSFPSVIERLAPLPV